MTNDNLLKHPLCGCELQLIGGRNHSKECKIWPNNKDLKLSPTPDKLAEARKLLENFYDDPFDWEFQAGRDDIKLPHQFIEDLVSAQDLVSRTEQKKEILNRIKAEHDKYCGKLEKKDDWFEIAINKINS